MSQQSQANNPDVPVRFDPERLISEHQAGVWRYCRALGCSTTEADDITQETFLKVLQKPIDDHSRMATAAYLRKVAFSRFINSRKREGKYIHTEKAEEISQQWAQLASDDQGEGMLEALKDCISTLTERARKALDLRFRERETRANIAHELGITEHGAKNLMQRAKKQLRGCIETKLHEQ